MFHLAHHRQRLGAGVQDVALLMAQRLDSESDVVGTSNVTGHAKEVGDLIVGALP